MDKIKELVREVVTNSTDEDTVDSVLYRVSGFKRSNYIDRDSYLTDCEPHILKSLWSNAFNIGYSVNHDRTNNASCSRYHYDKMSITKWIATTIDKIGKDKTFYFIGKRFTKTSIISALCNHYNWTWEKKDPSKADFFVLGDAPNTEDASLNMDLKKPVLMDEDLRSANHFLFNEEVTIDDIDNDLISNYLNKSSYDNLKLVASMIQYLKDGVLSDQNKFRLIRSYVITFKDRIAFDLRNKDHVWLSDTVLNYCHRQHRHLVTAKYLKTSVWKIELDPSGSYELNTYKQGIGGYVGTQNYGRIKVYFSAIHNSEGMDDVIKQDLEEFNDYSIIKKPQFGTYTKYISQQINVLIDKKLFNVRITFHDNPLTVTGFMEKDENNKFKCLGCGVSESTYESRVLDSYINKFFNKSDWEESLKGKISKLLEDSLSFDGNEPILDVSHLASYLDLDEAMVNANIVKKSNLEKLKFKARKLALIG